MKIRWAVMILVVVGTPLLARSSAADEVVEAGADHPAFKSALYRPKAEPDVVAGPLRLHVGPNLLLDDYLIAKSDGVARRIESPVRDPKLNNPVVTGKEDLNFQPFMSILRDAQTGKFRIWYGAPHEGGGSYLATMASEDGIHWQRPTRVLDVPAYIQFGCSVIDEGPAFADASARYKYGWYGQGGLTIAVSPDGLTWTLLTPEAVVRHNHDINNIFWDSLRKRYVAMMSFYGEGPTWDGKRRATLQSTSKDLLHWEKPWFVLTPDDASDPPNTEFYSMNGHLIRGDLWISLVKVLHDNQQAEGTPAGSYGIGHTQLAWSRDGENWVRDQTPYFEPDPTPGTWDHAHAWMDFQTPVGDEVYIYYGGYKNGHKVNRFEERQIGLVRIPRDRYVSRDAGPSGGTLTTPPVILEGSRMTVNASVRGELRVRLLDTAGQPIPGFDADDCPPIRGDAVALPVAWKQSLSTLKDKAVWIEFQMKDARLYAFDLAE